MASDRPFQAFNLRGVSLTGGSSAVVVIIPRSWSRRTRSSSKRLPLLYARLGGQAASGCRRTAPHRSSVAGNRRAIRQFRAGRADGDHRGRDTDRVLSGTRQILHLCLCRFGNGDDDRSDGNRRAAGLPGQGHGSAAAPCVTMWTARSPTQRPVKAMTLTPSFTASHPEIVARLHEWNSRGKIVLPSVAFEEHLFAQTQAALSALPLA